MITDNIKNVVTLEPVKKEDFNKFKKDLQDSFSVAVIETFGFLGDEPIPADKDIEESFNANGAETFHIVMDGTIYGGVIVTIDKLGNHNHLDFFFINKGEESKGIGYRAWQAIETKYPETKIWETVTPYFEKRNIHFYVNKCGFKIVEYYNKHNPDPHMPAGEAILGDEDDDLFRFEKIMKKQSG